MERPCLKKQKMCVCFCVSVSVCARINISVCVFLCVDICMFVCMYIKCMNVYMHVFMCII